MSEDGWDLPAMSGVRRGATVFGVRVDQLGTVVLTAAIVWMVSILLSVNFLVGMAATVASYLLLHGILAGITAVDYFWLEHLKNRMPLERIIP